ncbi:MAG TPA: hypothetical protein VNJ52_13565 [Patescibacteria group bacterium]|nr:hypothetical protein [Patescibacteria group bacterium]
MSGESFTPQPITMFGGWVPNAAPEGLPDGMSWDCQDVELIAGGVRTRPGLLAQFPTLTGGAFINYLKTFPTLGGIDRLLALDSRGNFYKENPSGSLQIVSSALAAGSLARSQTQFGREYLAVSDGQVGADLPRQFDDTNFDRVSQAGPGAAPQVSDFQDPIQSISRASNVVTASCQYAHTLAAGDTVTIQGVTGSATDFNGTFTVASVLDASQFTYAQTGPDEPGNSVGSSAAPAGNVSAGTHQVSISFVTRQGYWTRPSPPVTWTAAGNFKALLEEIPMGPSNVVARLVMFTAAGQSGAPSFYTIPPSNTPQTSPTAMYIPDNTTTEAIFDFSDVELLAATPSGYLFDLVELPEQAGVIAYSNRLFWWGERNGFWSQKNGVWLNLTFDGGWNNFYGVDPTVPLGWTADPAEGAGGSRESATVAWGDAYRITGDGQTAIRGKITQPAVTDCNGIALISPNTEYSVRARVMAYGLATGTLHVNLASASTGMVTAGLAVAASAAPQGAYAEFVAQLTPPIGSIPSDLALQIYADGTPTQSGYFLIDNIEIYETDLGNGVGSILRCSRVNDPESYDGVNGLMTVSPNDGQRITNAFVLRNNLYIVKERSFYVTADDGVNEPAFWTIQQVSNRVGTPSIHGVAMGDEAAVIAGQDGVYVFDGSPPQKLSQEIHSDQRHLGIGPGPVWDQVNWAAAQTLWVILETDVKRLLVGVPIGAATQPNWTLAMQFSYGSASLVNVTRFMLFRDAPLARGWAPWSIAASCAAPIARPGGGFPIFLGSNDGSGNIFSLAEGTSSDNGKVIPARYATYFVDGSDLGSPPVGRKLFGYLRARAEGQGTLLVAAFPAADRAVAISSIARGGNLATVTTAAPHGLFARQPVAIECVADASFNGPATIFGVLSATEFTYANQGPNAVSSGGDVVPLLGTRPLSSPASSSDDLELPINVSGERLSARFGIAANGNPGDWFYLSERIELYLKIDPWSPFGSP